MHEAPILHQLFIIFAGAALLATAALFTRQSLLVAYILLGVLFGPSGLAWVDDPELLQQTSQIGVIFLLFLLGLNMHPQKLLRMMRSATLVTILSSLAFTATGFLVGIVFGFTVRDAFVIGLAAMFSSTIIGLKLLPTTALHHQHSGEIIISILLLQDLLAIALLLGLQGVAGQAGMGWELARMLLSLPLLFIAALALERWLLGYLFARFDTIHEYVFLLALGWCLGFAQVGTLLGLSPEIGAFVAGVALAASPISTYIAEHLKPLRDFFLILFFFTLGAGFDLAYLPIALGPALTLAVLLLVIKPLVFDWLLRRSGETPELAREVGVRLGQISEFSLFVIVAAASAGLASDSASYVIQLATLLTFAISSYYIMLRYPTPIAVSARLRRD